MNLVNDQRPYSKEWDDLLKYILLNHVSVNRKVHTIEFKVLTKRSFMFWKSYTTYEVWTANKSCTYANLYRINGSSVGRANEFAPSQEAMQMLYKVEINEIVKDSSIYKIPEVK